MLWRFVPNSIPWLAKSPELSPIEYVWDYIKRRFRSQPFTNADQIYYAIRKEWDGILNEILQSIYSSFQAGLYVCAKTMSKT